LKGKNCKNFSLIGSVYFLLVRGRLSSSFLVAPYQREVMSLWKMGWMPVFAKCTSENTITIVKTREKYRIMSNEDPLGKTSPCWIIPSSNIRCLKWFSVPKKVYLTKFPSSVYHIKPQGTKIQSNVQKAIFTLSTHVICTVSWLTGDTLNCVRSYDVYRMYLLHNIEKWVGSTQKEYKVV